MDTNVPEAPHLASTYVDWDAPRGPKIRSIRSRAGRPKPRNARRPDYLVLSRNMLADPRLNAGDVCVYALYHYFNFSDAKHGRGDIYCSVRQSLVGRFLNLSRHAVSDHLTKLQCLGLLNANLRPVTTSWQKINEHLTPPEGGGSKDKNTFQIRVADIQASCLHEALVVATASDISYARRKVRSANGTFDITAEEIARHSGLCRETVLKYLHRAKGVTIEATITRGHPTRMRCFGERERIARLSRRRNTERAARQRAEHEKRQAERADAARAAQAERDESTPPSVPTTQSEREHTEQTEGERKRPLSIDEMATLARTLTLQLRSAQPPP